MSKVKCMRCDKCGELIIGDDPHGTFRGALWPSEIESFDLCRDEIDYSNVREEQK